MSLSHFHPPTAVVASCGIEALPTSRSSSIRRWRGNGLLIARAGLQRPWSCQFSHALRTPRGGDCRGMVGNALNRRKYKPLVVQSGSEEQSKETLDTESSGNVASKDSDQNRGPPVLTIIAGILVLILVFWAVGSFVAWLVGLGFR